MILDGKYITTKNNIIKAERRILKELGFCVHVKHPHKMIVTYLQVLECEKNRRLVQTAWNYMNDSLRTHVFVRYPPETIACACIYLSARQLNIFLPNNPAWYGVMGATEHELQDIALTILRLYTRAKKTFNELDKEVEKCRKFLQNAKLQAKGLLPSDLNSMAGTPTNFSPHSSSRPNSPNKVKTESPGIPNSYNDSNSAVKEEPINTSNSEKQENGKVNISKSKRSKSKSRSRNSSGHSSGSSRSRSRDRKPRGHSKKDIHKRNKRERSRSRHRRPRSHKRKHSHSSSRSRSRSRSSSFSPTFERKSSKYRHSSPSRRHHQKLRPSSHSHEHNDKYRKFPKHDRYDRR